MLRCPFNNFSKCDGNCPFSTENFNACKLASALTIIEGLGRSQAAQATTTNAHLVEIKEKLDALAAGPALADGQDAPRVVCKHPEQPRLMLGPNNNIRLIIPNDMGNEVWAALGERASYSITGSGEVLLYAGEDRKLSTHGTSSKNTRSISMQGDVKRLVELFPNTRVAYMRMEAHGGIFRFTPTGERE